MNTSPQLESDRLAELIACKHGVLAQIHQLAQRQLEIVASGDTAKLLGLLAAKQKLLNALQALERNLDPFREQDPDARRWRSNEQRQRTRQIADDCRSLLNQTMDLEQQSERRLADRRDTTAARLQSTHNALQASQAYNGSRQAGPTQLDLSSER